MKLKNAQAGTIHVHPRPTSAYAEQLKGTQEGKKGKEKVRKDGVEIPKGICNMLR